MSASRTPVRRLGLAAVLTVASLLLASCGYGSQAPKSIGVAHTADGKKLSADQVRIGYFPNLTHATALIGVQRGIFQQDLGGTQVKGTTFDAGPSEVEAINAGSIDIGFLGPSPAINAYTASHGKSLRIIAGSASGGVKLVVNPKKITTQSDLKGKKIATPQLGNTQDVAFLNYLNTRRLKVDPQSGKGAVSVVREDNAVTVNAFRTGQIDGAWVPEPTASQLLDEGGKTLIDESDLWPDKKFVITNIVVSQAFLKAHPDVVEAVLKGSVDTDTWIDAHQDTAKRSANDALKALTGKPLKQSVIDSAWPSIRITDDPLASTLKAEADHAVAASLLKQPDLEGIYDLDPLNKVLRAKGRPIVSDAGLGMQ